jgi:outer membrane protein assembly factor BamB
MEARMPRDPKTLVFVGIKDVVVALDDRTGAEVWRTELRANDHVMVYFDGEAVFAANSGEVWRIDAQNGTVLWHNEMKGLGRGLVSLASSRMPGNSPAASLIAEKKRQEAAAAAAT